MSELINTRSLDIIGAEIRALTGSMLNSVIEIGRRMAEAKELVPHGQFGQWVKENTGYSASTAENFMRLFKAYGEEQGSLFGASAKSQLIGNLSYTKALELLALPEGERESFAQEVDAESITVKELKQRIAEREQNLRLANERADRNAEAIDRLEKELKEEKAKPVEVAVREPTEEELAALTEEARAKAGEEIGKIRKKLEAAEKAKAAAEEKLKKAEEKAKAAAEAAAKSGERELAEAKARAEEAEKKAALADETARIEVENLRKQLAMADPITAEFKGLFEQTAGLVGKLTALAAKAPAEQAEKMRKAMAALAGQLAGRPKAEDRRPKAEGRR